MRGARPSAPRNRRAVPPAAEAARGDRVTKPLTAMQERYCQARAMGQRQAEAARTAGAAAERVWSTKTERKPAVQARIQALKRAAQILAEASGPGSGVTHSGATEGNAALMAALPAVADLAEALGHATRIMRSNVTSEAIRPDGSVDIEALRNAPPGVLRKYKAKSRIQRVPGGEGETEEIREVGFEAESTLSAAQLLVRHYDGLDAPAGGVTVNVAIIDRLRDVRERRRLSEEAHTLLVEERRRG